MLSPSSVRTGTLAVSWSETKNDYGTFAWQGDGLTWTHPDINRPNTMAWYVCEEQNMFINLGPYLYDTPAGCADQTVSCSILAFNLFQISLLFRIIANVHWQKIHYYNDKTAND